MTSLWDIVPKGPLRKYLRTAGSRKERQAKRHKQGPLRRAMGNEQKTSRGKDRGEAGKQAGTD
eukprot:1148744-Pelagomonas_calceolata.AAC.2